MKRKEDCTDEELMTSYAQGEYEAFQELYERHSGKVLGFLLKRIAHTGEAEDLMQTVFLKLHQSRERYDAKFPFLAWVFTITRNTLIDYLRKAKNIPLEDDKLQALVDQKAAVLIPVESSEGDLKSALSHLPDGQRKAVELRFAEGLSFEEISKKLGLSEEGVRKRVSRGVKRVRELFN